MKKCPANVFDRTVMKYCEQLNYVVAKYKKLAFVWARISLINFVVVYQQTMKNGLKEYVDLANLSNNTFKLLQTDL